MREVTYGDRCVDDNEDEMAKCCYSDPGKKNTDNINSRSGWEREKG